jgi:hypothetical protein
METSFASSAKVWDSSVGEFVSARHQEFAEAIHDYNPYFSLVFVPEHARDESDTKPFALLDSSPDTLQKSGSPQIIRYISEREMADPAAILAWLFEGDLSKHRPVDVFERLEMKRVAQELLDKKHEMEEAEDRQDVLANVISGGRDKKFWYKHDGHTFRR